jgi:hypothetical protein
MSKAYGEPVDVQARDDGRPTGFTWQSRWYTVRVILEHWVINRDWWRDPQAEPGQLELELWRVAASPTPDVPPCRYELRREAATNAWILRR